LNKNGDVILDEQVPQHNSFMHRKVSTITLSQPGEGRNAHQALSAKPQDTLWIVMANRL